MEVARFGVDDSEERSHLGTLAKIVASACRLEAFAPKVGNVHPQAPFRDMSYREFERSAELLASTVTQVGVRDIGRWILESVRATSCHIGVNTNLGIVLLFGPLCHAMFQWESTAKTRPQDDPFLSTDFEQKSRQLKRALPSILESLSPIDSQHVYEAIRLAHPGGLGQEKEMDIQSIAPPTLLEAMKAAADRDQIAAEYVNGYERCFEMASLLSEAKRSGLSWSDAICDLQLHSLAEQGDTLIRRKNGTEVEAKVQQMANDALEAKTRDPIEFCRKRDELDHYLRDPQNKRNPGTTADLIAAALLIVLWCRHPEGVQFPELVPTWGENESS